MRCPFCGYEDTKVADSRPSAEKSEIRRRRFCPSCGRKFTTYERPEINFPMIVKKSGVREMYMRDKLLNGLRKACEKREVSAMQLEQIADRVELELLSAESREVPSSLIGETVMNELSKIDHVAYVRFASVYKEFEELDDFKDEVEKLLKRLRGKKRTKKKKGSDEKKK